MHRMVLPSRMAVLNHMSDDTEVDVKQVMTALKKDYGNCLLYTSDAADE